MHVGFIVQNLSKGEIDDSSIQISEDDREMFPKEGVLFFMESYEEIFGCHIDSFGKISGLDEWFKQFPVAREDIVIISKYTEGFILSTMSEIVEQQQHFVIEMDRILALEPTDIFCPNCRYNLEHAGKASRADSYILKCARCGFTLVKKSI
ncbi:MAG: hypothetical protein GOP50_11090 [Candidatus Heimdallarchaeota archaeon]|nr:hypothetical protein [Candidatus Heimdallarchaeota archaeon]